MLKYKLLAFLIIIICIFLSCNIIMWGIERYSEVEAAQASFESYKERMSSPVNALTPSSSNIFYNGLLEIPKLGVRCQIRSDTVNAYDAVYHYPESVNPGKKGECALLGHRTSYSGLFKDIGSLKTGDEIIIKDFTLKKQYIYQVTSNGEDIRWDYQTNPIRFAYDGEPRLLLITCYPPGTKEAAWITHCKLVSTKNL